MRRKLWGRLYWWEQYNSAVLILLMVLGVVVAIPAGIITTRHAAERRQIQAAETTQAPPAKKVFVSQLAGQWYPADLAQLKADLESYFAKAPAQSPDNVHALILPHAGYPYSGPIAAAAVKSVAGKTFSRVIVMGPSHGLAMENVANVPDATHYATLLGEVPLDVELIAALKRHPQFKTIPGADETEHSVQIEIPLLQHALGEFTLVPIVVGQLDEPTTREMGRILSGLIDANTLVVASSDFTHYGPRFGYVPFRDDLAANLKKLDMGAWEGIANKDLEAFAQYIDKTGATICGRNPIGILLAMLPKDFEAHQVAYDTSGNLTGDYGNSVSYLSAAFSGAWPAGEKAAAPAAPAAAPTSLLSDEDKTLLLKLARGVLEAHVTNGGAATPESLGIKLTPGMQRVMGAFVTLNENGQLRGCIGEIFPRRPLYKAVMDHAVNAAANDPRFQPVKADELPRIEMDISALTEPRPVASYNDIVIGKHGMVLEKWGRSAVFLPQVAPEQGWTLDETLTHLAMKAGLPPDAWKDGASFTVFEAIVFSEKDSLASAHP
ncbi:MAG: AmmeMemoRadiSam system protein B [Candidatus Hydrogenedentes bacterium]|nr:AmmeMemoRadiSam system protein B [Candidatus Hydrogenedentota bacterium]